MNDVDNYYIGKACNWWDDRNPAYFYYNIAEEMIDNRWTEGRALRNQAGQPIEHCCHIRRIIIHYTPTKKHRKINTPYGLKDIKFLAQSICKVCRKKPIYVCRNYGDYICNDKSGRFYLDTHCKENNYLSH